jgi:hypothetical protein
MKILSAKAAAITCLALFSMGAFAQIPKIKAPKVTVPSISTGGTQSSGSGSPTIPGKDPSGLFSKVTDDPSAQVHRKNAVANLETLEAEYKKPSVDYEAMTKLMFENERTLGHIAKLEPNVDRSKYDERYLPIKARADKENAAYAEAEKLEQLFDQQFDAPAEFKKPEVMTYRTGDYYGHEQCYCRNYDSETKTLADFEAAKAKYEGYTSQLVGYSHEGTQKIFANTVTCIQNGNNFAVWACKEELQDKVVKFNTENTASKPERVIERCDKYQAALDRIESDNTLRFEAPAKAAFTEAKATIAKIKSDNETYISSGKFQAYLDKVHAEEIAKVFLPKAVTKNASVEAGASTYVKGAEFAEFAGAEEAAVTVLRTVTVTAEPIVETNEFGIPKWQYHEVWVAYKAKNGRCYMVPTYATYQYKGGGTYGTVPTWGADYPDELACGNVSK